jgi:F-type H+-transporting ATPase subunit delta
MERSRVAEHQAHVSGVAGRYAAALHELAVEAGAVDSVLADLQAFDRMVAESAELHRFVKSPIFSAEEQVKALGALLDKAGIKGFAANFLKLVAQRRRLFAIRDMISAYAAIVDNARGIVRATAIVAEKPSQAVLDSIKSALKDLAGDKAVVDVTVDPAIIGGIVVKLGSKMVDASLRTKLNGIRIAMKEVG